MTVKTKILTLLTAAILAFVGCGGGDDADNNSNSSATESDKQNSSRELRIAVMPTLDCLPIYIASETGIFSRESLSVALVPFTAHMDCDTAFAGGSVQVMPTDVVRAERLIHEGTPLHYVTSTGLGWQLLTAKTARIRKLEQLDDKMLAMTRYSATAMLSDQFVESAKLKPERVFRIQVNDVLVRLNMMETGTMDAMLLPEPQATVARKLGCNTLFDSTTDSLALGVIAFRIGDYKSPQAEPKDTLRRQQMEAFVRIYDEACDSISIRGLDHYRNIITERCHVQPDIVDSLILQHAPDFHHAVPPTQAAINRAKTWLGYLSVSKPKSESRKGRRRK